ERLRAARGRRPLRRRGGGRRGAGDRRGGLHHRHVGLSRGDERPVLPRADHRLHLSAHRQLRRLVRGDGIRSHPRLGGDHARGGELGGRSRRGGRLARLAGRLRHPRHHRRRHARAGAPHPRRGSDARRHLHRGRAGSRGARADRRGALDERPRPRPGGDDRRTAGRLGRRRRPAHRRARHRHQVVDRAQLRLARRDARAAPVHDAGRRAARPRPRRLLPGPGAGRSGGARLRRRDDPHAAGPQAGLRHLPRPSAAVAGGRPGDLQAPLRPPRIQPPGQGPALGRDRHHVAEPRLRGGRSRRRASAHDRRAGALGDRLRGRRADPPEPLRPHRRGNPPARRTRRVRAVPPGGGTRSQRLASAVRRLRQGDDRRCL
ncbi:MAG: Carbamoyl-phosphate synthase small chain, partial [uncultured Solirubrobacteraceae bacterium]